LSTSLVAVGSGSGKRGETSVREWRGGRAERKARVGKGDGGEKKRVREWKAGRGWESREVVREGSRSMENSRVSGEAVKW